MLSANETPVPRPRLSILLVDDNVDTVMTLGQMLSDQGHIVHTCVNAKIVIATIQRHKPDICVLDIVMPAKTGFTIAREVLALKLDERPVLVAMSGVFNSRSDEVIAMSAGFDHFVQKGEDPSALLRLINSYAGQVPPPAAA